jgi:hypothetical protein
MVSHGQGANESQDLQSESAHLHHEELEVEFQSEGCRLKTQQDLMFQLESEVRQKINTYAGLQTGETLTQGRVALSLPLIG